MKYRIGMVGSGYMARKHCDALVGHSQACLYAVCSTEKSEHQGRQFMERYGFGRLTTDYHSLLADPGVDIVFICAPDNVHPALLIDAIAADKHIFCEKPLGTTLPDFEAIRERLRLSNVRLQVGMNCRFREQYSIPKRIATSGELGELRFLRGTYVYNTVKSVQGGKRAWSLTYPGEIFPFLHSGGIHCLDLLRWIGGEPESVFARAAGFELTQAYRADTFSISLGFSNGAVGELLVAASAFRPNDFSLELWFSQGSIVGRGVFRREGDAVRAQGEDILVEQKALDLVLQYEDLIGAIENGGQPLNSFDEAYANFKALRAIERSIAYQRLVHLTEGN